MEISLHESNYVHHNYYIKTLHISCINSSHVKNYTRSKTQGLMYLRVHVKPSLSKKKPRGQTQWNDPAVLLHACEQLTTTHSSTSKKSKNRYSSMYYLNLRSGKHAFYTECLVKHKHVHTNKI